MEEVAHSNATTQESGSNQRKRKCIASSDDSLSEDPSDSGPRIEQGVAGSPRTAQSVLISTLTLTKEWRPYLEPTIITYLGAERQQIPQSKFLSHILEHGLDSPCMVCSQGFNDGDPPIRTVAFETSQDLLSSSLDITQTPIAPHPIRIFNRHFTCIKEEKIKYIPVSHAWNQVVSTAQKGHVQNIEIARLVYQIPIKSLFALSEKDATTEIWHDYLSVPQWQPKIQQQLLLAIPTIYSYPSRMVMHLDDVQITHLDAILQNANYQTFIEGISKLTRSRWVDRMWVTLEYIQGQEVSILTEEFHIFNTSARDLSLRVEENIAKYVRRFGHDKFTENALAKGYRWP